MVNAIRYEDLRDVVLLGSSYGGVVVTGALDLVGDRVREVVHLDAFVPADGDSVATRYQEIATTHVVPENRRGELVAILRTLA